MTVAATTRTSIALLLGAICAGTSGAARAQAAPGSSADAAAVTGWPASPEDEEGRLGRFLDEQRAVELSQYWSVAIGALAVGAPQIALGTYLQGQSDVAAQAIGPGLIVGGAADCLIGLGPLLAPTPMSTLKAFYDSERNAGKPASDVVRDTEETWRRLVAAQRRARLWGGVTDLVVGVPPFVTGLVFALAKPGLGGMTSQTQYGWAGALVGFDFLIYQGVVAIAAPPPVDTAFDTYQLLKHGGISDVAPKIGFSPAPGGGTIDVRARF